MSSSAEEQRSSILEEIESGRCPLLHWVDNFAKFSKSSLMFLNKDLLRSLLWTAHGVKRLPAAVDLKIKRDFRDQAVFAMPSIVELLSRQEHKAFLTMLKEQGKKRLLFETSLAVVGNVVRIPLKGNPADEEEEKHFRASFDGLSLFHPVDIYPDNITSNAGLLSVFRRLQNLEGFGQPGNGSYSLLSVDVSIYWKLFRLVQAYSGMESVRRELVLCFGFWHAYHYAHVALWNEYRATFLAAAFFALFPEQKLLRRPSLTHSSTFFTWLRL